MKLTDINRAEAFRYMGMRGEIPENIVTLADECESRLIAAASPKFYWIYADIADISEETVTLAGHKLVLRGKDISEHLNGCFGTALLCATLGDGVDKLLRTVQTEDMAKALTADALSSAAVEQVCDIAEKEIGERFAGKFTTWRFSPGSGRFPCGCKCYAYRGRMCNGRRLAHSNKVGNGGHRHFGKSDTAKTPRLRNVQYA